MYPVSHLPRCPVPCTGRHGGLCVDVCPTTTDVVVSSTSRTPSPPSVCVSTGVAHGLPLVGTYMYRHVPLGGPGVGLGEGTERQGASP